MKKILVAAAALLASTLAANATPISGTWTATASDTHSTLTQDFASPFTLNLTLGTPFTVVDFLQISDNSSVGTTNNITANFTFTSPTGTGSATGVDGYLKGPPGSEVFTGGAAQLVNLSDGSILSVQFGNASQTCTSGNCNTTVLAPMTFTLTSAATRDVPEPLTVSLFGAGLVGLGMMRRRKKAAEEI